jgi:type VI secretion system protein ImpF
MQQFKPITGARALLFDRLVDLHPEDKEERPFRVLNREELKASVKRELERLLNTRCSLPLDRIGEVERSVVNYGIPDFSSLSPRNEDDHALIASIIRQTVSAFEPRLNQVRVDAGALDDTQGSLWLNIEGMLRVDLHNEPVSFDLVLNSKSGAADFNDSE